jgi:putative aldouronate transport system substrate-binding protein
MNKKVISLLLALLMLASFSAGCNKKVTASPTPSAAASASPTPSASAAPTPGVFKLPITDAKTTFTAWMPSAGISTTAGMKTANDSKAYQEAEKRTNIHIEWQHPTVGNEQENFNLIMASQSYPDAMISGASAYYIGGYDAYIDNGVILDLTDLIKNNAPNYAVLRTSTDEIRRRTMTDVGRLPYFRTIGKTFQPSFWGPLVRQDLLDAAGYKGSPETYTEFHDMLAALKGKVKIAPLYFFQKTGLEEELMVGFGVNASWYQAAGKVKFGPI